MFGLAFIISLITLVISVPIFLVILCLEEQIEIHVPFCGNNSVYISKMFFVRQGDCY